MIALALAAQPASAGVLRGTVRLPATRAAALAGSAGTRATVTDAVVYLEAIPPKLEKKLARKAPRTAAVTQRRGAFEPSPLAIVAGTPVTFRNGDRTWHNVFSISPTRRFDVGKYAPGSTREVSFGRVGAVQLFCDVDPGESGWICVLPNHAVARPDARGAFELPKLPKGRYRLRVWLPGLAAVARDVEMPRRGDVSVDVRL